MASGAAGISLGLSVEPPHTRANLSPDLMACEAPSPPPSPSLSLSPPTSPEPELAQLRRKVEKLERELRSCKRQVREIEKLLHHTERLYQSAESNNQELRTQVRCPPLAPSPFQPCEVFEAFDGFGRAPELLYRVTGVNESLEL